MKERTLRHVLCTSQDQGVKARSTNHRADQHVYQYLLNCNCLVLISNLEGYLYNTMPLVFFFFLLNNTMPLVTCILQKVPQNFFFSYELKGCIMEHFIKYVIVSPFPITVPFWHLNHYKYIEFCRFYMNNISCFLLLENHVNNIFFA